MVDYIYRHCNRILTSSNSFITAIAKRKISRDTIEFWPQYAEDFYKPVDRERNYEIPDDGVLNLVFAGNIGFAQGLGILPKAAQKLKQDNITVRFNVIGDGRYLPELKQLVNELQVEEYFNFIDRKTAEEIPAYLAAADALLITLSKSEVFAITIPAKTQSCLACGRPIIVSADGEVQQIIKAANAGLYSDAEDVDGFVNCIKEFSRIEKTEREKLGENALKYSKEHFDKDKLLNRMDEILQGGKLYV
jgi:glycosyltransferase involved in cell wall biosynthesis